MAQGIRQMAKSILLLIVLFAFLGCGGSTGKIRENIAENAAENIIGDSSGDTIEKKVTVHTKYAPFYPIRSENVTVQSSFIYSFLVTDGDTCLPRWDWAKERDWRNFSDKIQSDGILSFGGVGAEAKSLAYVCDEEALLTVLKDLIDTYRIRWLDFDIEADMLYENDANLKRFKVLKRLLHERPDVNISLTLPAMPEGLTEDVRRLIQKAKAIQLPIASYNLMLMDFGYDYPAEDENQTLMYHYSKSALIHANEDLKTLFHTDKDFFKQLGAIVMIGKNDVTNEIVYPKDFVLLKNFVVNRQMALLSFWSIIRDRPGRDLQTSTGMSPREYGNTPYQYFHLGKL